MRSFLRSSIFTLFSKISPLKISLIDEIVSNKLQDVSIAINLKQNMNYYEFCCGIGYIYPLFTAVFYNHHDMVKLMIEKGEADPNFIFIPRCNRSKEVTLFEDPQKAFSITQFPGLPSEVSAGTDEWTLTPTTLAFLLGCPETLEVCLENGGKISEMFNSNRSLVSFFLTNKPSFKSESCRLLFEYGIFSGSSDDRLTFSEFFHTVRKFHDSDDLFPNNRYDLRVIMDYFIKNGYLSKDGDIADAERIEQEKKRIFQKFGIGVYNIITKTIPLTSSEEENKQIKNKAHRYRSRKLSCAPSCPTPTTPPTITKRKRNDYVVKGTQSANTGGFGSRKRDDSELRKRRYSLAGNGGLIRESIRRRILMQRKKSLRNQSAANDLQFFESFN